MCTARDGHADDLPGEVYLPLRRQMTVRIPSGLKMLWPWKDYFRVFSEPLKWCPWPPSPIPEETSTLLSSRQSGCHSVANRTQPLTGQFFVLKPRFVAGRPSTPCITEMSHANALPLRSLRPNRQTFTLLLLCTPYMKIIFPWRLLCQWDLSDETCAKLPRWEEAGSFHTDYSARKFLPLRRRNARLQTSHCAVADKLIEEFLLLLQPSLMCCRLR